MSGRFVKGQSGNPNGRPRKLKQVQPSPFDIIVERTLPVTENGIERQLSVEEALQLKTFQQALAGSRMAQRAVLKMIAKREAVLAKRRPARTLPKPREEHHGKPIAAEALKLLELVSTDPTDRDALQLEPWAVELAITRQGGVEVSDLLLRSMSILTRDGMALRFRYRAS